MYGKFISIRVWMALSSLFIWIFAAPTAVAEKEASTRGGQGDKTLFIKIATSEASVWRKIRGNWRFESGELRTDASDGRSTILFSAGGKRQNCVIEADVAFEKATSEDSRLSIVFRATADGSSASHCYVKPKATDKRGCGFAVWEKDHWSERQTAPATRDFETGGFRHLKVVVQGETVKAYLDGEEVFSSPYCVDAPTGMAGLGAQGCSARFKNFSVTPLPDTQIPPSERHDYLIIAHRGYSAKYPENTIAAFRGGIEAGANGIEFDIHRCASGEIVVMHDATVDRTTDGTGRIDQLTLSELRKLDAGSWKGERFAGEPIPTLDETLGVFDGCDATAVIEIKARDVDAGELDRIISSHRAKVCVISFLQEKLDELKQVDPNIRCGLLVGGVPDGRQPAEWMVQQARKVGCEVLSVNYRALSRETVRAIRENGIEVWAWTVDDLAVMRALVDWGIDGITTDIPTARP